MDRPSGESFEFFQRATRKRKSDWMASAHFHLHHELYYLVSGRAKYFVGSEIYLLNSGDFILIPKNQYHKTEYQSDTDVERLMLIFDEEFLGEEYQHYMEPLTKIKHIRVPADELHPFRSILKKIEVESEQKRDGYLDMQKMYLRQLLILLSRHGREAVSQGLSETYKMAQDAARYISTNCSKDLSLKYVAELYSLSPGHFSKQFKKATGVGFTEYVLLSRIHMAKEMLESGEKNISAVALACGFNDSNYFSRVFKKLNGISPKKYISGF